MPIPHNKHGDFRDSYVERVSEYQRQERNAHNQQTRHAHPTNIPRAQLPHRQTVTSTTHTSYGDMRDERMRIIAEELGSESYERANTKIKKKRSTMRSQTPSFQDVRQDNDAQISDSIHTVGSLVNRIDARGYAKHALHNMVGTMYLDEEMLEYASNIMRDALDQIERNILNNLFLQDMQYGNSNDLMTYKVNTYEEIPILESAMHALLPNNTILYCLQGMDNENNNVTIAVTQPRQANKLYGEGPSARNRYTTCARPHLHDELHDSFSQMQEGYACTVCDSIEAHSDSPKSVVAVFQSSSDKDDVVYALGTLIGDEDSNIVSNIRLYISSDVPGQKLHKVKIGRDMTQAYADRYKGVMEGYVSILLRRINPQAVHNAEGRNIISALKRRTKVK